MRLFGLIGKTLTHSFSPSYFNKKFSAEHIKDCTYELFEIEQIGDIVNILNKKDLIGFNVTIPYKEEIIPYLDYSEDAVKQIGAVNTVWIKENELHGYNTDIIGFKTSLSNFIGTNQIDKAIILGSGGASKAAQFVLNQMNIEKVVVSRRGTYNYDWLCLQNMTDYQLIVNCTPLGMFPNISDCPEIPYHKLNNQHFLYDMVYNPSETLFMKKGVKHGAVVCNGYQMLVEQAEAAWKIWNNKI